MRLTQTTCTTFPWMWISVLLLHMPWLVKSAKLFPDFKNVAHFSPINSSSTCGSPAIKVCRSSIQTSSLDVCQEDTCKFACCDSCNSTKPVPTDLGTIKPIIAVGITNGPSRPGSANTSFNFVKASDSHMDPLNLGPSVNYDRMGFAISIWVKQKDANKGTLLSKTLSSSPYKVIYHLEIENYKIWFNYQYRPAGNKSVVEIAPLPSQSQNLKPNEWHLITVTVVSTYLSYFIDGKFIKAWLLKGEINDPGGRVRIGQRYGGSSQYEGLMQDIFLYNKALTNREVVEVFSGVLPKVYVASQCRCPPAYPKVMETTPANCTRNGNFSSGQTTLRLADTAHPIELATDGDTSTYWQSTLTNAASIYLDLKYGELQIFYIILEFYGPQPSAIKIDRSRDNGLTFQPWQYFAEDCVRVFNMQNNGPLPLPDSINCIQYELPLKSSQATIAFKTEQAPPIGSSIPVRPFGAPCTQLYCSKKLLEFLKASHVKLSFFNHTLVKNDKHKYFALNRIVVAGRCECFGHAKSAAYTSSNATHNGKCVCHCDASTFTEGEKCDRCLPLYNKKPFNRGSNTNSYPCVKCQCNQHATSCYYNKTLDPSPDSRTLGGGGVCIDCQHNTTGRYCHTCKETFYRESGKSLNSSDVCSPCACTGPGVIPKRLDCVKDDTTPGVAAGQCECKQFAEGRQCNRCKPGYFNMSASNPDGCVSCISPLVGQGAPKVIKTNSYSISLTWTRPQTICSLSRFLYHVTRAPAAFNALPQDVTAGVHFPGLGYYKFPANIVTQGDRNNIEFSFRTQYPTGLLIFMVSENSQEDLLAVELRDGKPWFVFDCQSGPAAFTVSGNVRFDDSQWHLVKLTRKDDDGTIMIDGRYTGNGSSASGSNVIGGYTAVYIGGLPNDFKYTRTDSGNATLQRLHFIGCLKNFKSGNMFEWKNALEKVNVDPEVSGCPVQTDSTSTGALLRGGGFIAIKSELFKRSSIIPFALAFRTLIKSGLLAFAYGPSVYLGLVLNNGKLTLKLKGTTNSTSYEVPTNNLCDGRWNNVAIFPASAITFVISVNGKNHFRQAIGGVNVISNLYIGGMPLENKQVVQAAKDAGLDPDETFSGCVKSLQTADNFSLSRDVVEIRNADLDGCISNKTISASLKQGTCLEFNSTVLVTQKALQYTDSSVSPFVDYLYRVSSFHPGVLGSSKSPWISARSGPGNPEDIKAPFVTAKSSSSLLVKWSPPGTSNGYVINYIVRVLETGANFSMNSSNVFQYTVSGLKPYFEYSIVIRACTIGDCGDSPQVKHRTLTDSPSGQLAPWADVISSVELFVYWNPPTDPNGPISYYLLYRKTMEEPVNENFTVSARFSQVYTSSGREYYDGPLGIYSLQRYKVMVVTSAGNTTSPTSDHRTGPAPPLAGPVVNATAVNPTTVIVSWTPPSIRLLRGSVKMYTVYYEHVASSVVHRYASVPGNHASLAVQGLRPSTNYQFWVMLFNGAGNFTSSPVLERTMDGVPDGFDAPLLFDKSSTEIEVSWKPPTTPNGKIVIYKIYANGNYLANASANSTQVILSDLSPYTVYSIQVEVCTVYVCIKSPAAAIRTQQAGNDDGETTKTINT